MKPFVFLPMVLILILGLNSCNGQFAKEKKDSTAQNLPQTDVKVNKEYDENGNLIRYDSTYSSFYSNILGDTLLGDSLLNEFKSQFNERYFFHKNHFSRNSFSRIPC